MNFAITILRLPFGILATGMLLLWTLLIAAVFCAIFVYYAVFGKRSSIDSKVVPEFKEAEGTHLIPEVWRWVLNPNLGGDGY